MFKKIILFLIAACSLSSCYFIIPPTGVYNYRGYEYHSSPRYYYPPHLPPPRPKPCYRYYR